MLNVAICDDKIGICHQIENHMMKFAKANSISINCYIYNDPKELLQSNRRYSLYLLDVMMPKINGIELAELLNDKYEDPLIVFITSSLESAVDGYSVNAEGFILKPIDNDSFEKTMERIFSKHLFLKRLFIKLKYNRTDITVDTGNVLYFENVLHKVRIFLEEGKTITVSQNLNSIADLLKDAPNFLRCHQSYIVNMDYIKTLDDRDFLMENEVLIPISRSNYARSKSIYYKYVLE